jgi:DNA-binding transcriptional regulator YdaS (Cro superfamily)
MIQRNPIRAWRDLNDVSVKDFAEMVGVQDSAVCKWERRGVSASKALDVHRATGIPLHRLRPDIYPDPDDAARGKGRGKKEGASA